MREGIRPVGIGLVLGMLSLFFGIFWAIYLVAGHEQIHKTLEQSKRPAMEEKISPPETQDGHSHNHSRADEAAVGSEGQMPTHEDPAIGEAHEMLTRGHIHEMGLGMLAIAISVVLSMLFIPDWLKTIASACAGVGGLFYPVAWIVMGFRAPAIGMEAADKSVMPIAGFGIALVLIGLAITFFGTLKTVLTRR